MVDQPEFTDDELRNALKRVGAEARRTLFAVKRPLVVVKGNAVVAVYANGHEVEIERLKPSVHAQTSRE